MQVHTEQIFDTESSCYLKDRDILVNKTEKLFRLTTFIITFCEGVLTWIDIENFIDLGLHIIRFKMANVTRHDKIKLLGMLKKAVRNCCEKYDVSDWPIAISIDLPNANIRTGSVRQDLHGKFTLNKDDIIELTAHHRYWNKCCPSNIYIDDAKTLKIVQPGNEITIGFDEVMLTCIENRHNDTILCKVIKGGLIENNEHVVFRGVKNLKPDLSATDIELLQFAVEFKIDIITINYVRNTSVIKRVRKLFPPENPPLVISTICDQEGLDNVDDIILISDGVILAREFLGAHIKDIYKMPAIQLSVSAKCRKVGKPFFISGNILECTLLGGLLAHNDVSDITNAVMQGTGFLLKNYKEAHNLLKSIRILDSMCRYVENVSVKTDILSPTAQDIYMPLNAADACILACALTAKQVGATVIILTTVSGRTAVQLSQIISGAVVLAVTTNAAVARKLRFYRAILPIIYNKTEKRNWQEEMSTRINFGVSFGVKLDLLKYGNVFVALRKSSQLSAFADNISIWPVMVQESYSKQIYQPCPESIQNRGEAVSKSTRPYHHSSHNDT